MAIASLFAMFYKGDDMGDEQLEQLDDDVVLLQVVDGRLGDALWDIGPQYFMLEELGARMRLQRGPNEQYLMAVTRSLTTAVLVDCQYDGSSQERALRVFGE